MARKLDEVLEDYANMWKYAETSQRKLMIDYQAELYLSKLPLTQLQNSINFYNNIKNTKLCTWKELDQGKSTSFKDADNKENLIYKCRHICNGYNTNCEEYV